MNEFNGLPKLAALAAVATLAACSSNYIQPVGPSIEYQSFVDTELFTVWNSMVKTLTAAGYTVKKLDKESGTMSLVFKSNKPGEFVDCGQRTLAGNEEYKIRSLTFNPADSALYSTLDDDENLQNVVRSSNLKARASVFLAAHDDGTNIRINVNYDVYGRTKYYDKDNRFTDSTKFRYRLSTTDAYEGKNYVCVSRGVIEQQILDAATSS
ncbi:MAG: hypothetical protein HRU20_04735 [Pseudomonadales bacterium]|nr:hypothetical protein [Pseudomonadales bacterium]